MKSIVGLRSNVYELCMTDKAKRDNSYWTQRLEKDGYGDLLDRIDQDEITVYRATQLAGYRKTRPKLPGAKLAYHWERASHAERKRFVRNHLTDVNRVGREVLAEVRAEQAQKPSE